MHKLSDIKCLPLAIKKQHVVCYNKRESLKEMMEEEMKTFIRR